MASRGMTGGEGPNSYIKNSAYQGATIEAVKSIIQDEIKTKLDMGQLSLTGPNCIRIADFGSSTGHNSFPIIQTIIDAIEKKIEKEGTNLDFQVFYNDLAINDFNTLFSSLPPERPYHAAGVPGPFHGRLLPKASIHFAHTSWSLHWLSEVPKAVVDSKSPAWNKGKFFYVGAKKEVVDAYSSQFAKDIDSFLEARAEELVDGGLLALLLPGIPDSWDADTNHVLPDTVFLLESCFADMVNEGKLDEARVNSFNHPVYFPKFEELKGIIEKNGKYTIERTEILKPRAHHSFHPPSAMARGCKVTLEGLMIKYFEMDTIDEAYRRYEKKLASSSLYFAENDETITPFIVLKRKERNDISNGN